MARSEKFIAPPHSLHVKRSQRHLSVVERHLALLRMQEEEKRLMMEDEKEIIKHLMDYTPDETVDEYGFPYETRYQVSDNVPDMFVEPNEAEASPALEEKKVEEEKH